MSIERFTRIIETKTHQVLFVANYEEDEDRVEVTTNIEGMNMKITLPAANNVMEYIDKLTVEDTEELVEYMTSQIKGLLGR